MSFKYTWDEANPTGTNNSRKLHKYIKDTKRAIAERMEVQHIALDSSTVGATEKTLKFAQGRHEAGKISVLGIYRTESDAPVSPPDGGMIYTRNDQKLKYYGSSQWNDVPVDVDIDDAQENFSFDTSTLTSNTVVGGGTLAYGMLPAFFTCTTAQLVSLSFNVRVLDDDYHARNATYFRTAFGDKPLEMPEIIRNLPAYDIYFKLADASNELSIDSFLRGITLFENSQSERDPTLNMSSSLRYTDDPWFTATNSAPPVDEDFGTYFFGAMANCIDCYNFTKVMQIPEGIWAIAPLIFTNRSVVVLENSVASIRGYKI